MRITLILLLIVVGCRPASSSINNANELLSACESLVRSARPNGSNIEIPTSDDVANQCWGYVRAFQELSTITMVGQPTAIISACAPAEADELQWVRAFIAYAQRHPERLNEPAAFLAIDAFHTVFRCRAR
jgi:Rap1a immunity proteins